jgi:hypothetical protein
MRISKTAWRRAGIVGLIGAAAFVISAPPATTQSSNPPQYDSDGKLLRPVGFETWVFVGSNLGLTYKGEPKPKPDAEQYHNVFMKPQAYQEFVRDQKFTDRTVFVIDRLTAPTKNPTTHGWASWSPGNNLHRPDHKHDPLDLLSISHGGQSAETSRADEG